MLCTMVIVHVYVPGCVLAAPGEVGGESLRELDGRLIFTGYGQHKPQRFVANITAAV